MADDVPQPAAIDAPEPAEHRKPWKWAVAMAVTLLITAMGVGLIAALLWAVITAQ
jgi:hypothetical protein